MAQVLITLTPLYSSSPANSARPRQTYNSTSCQSWTSLTQKLKCKGKVSCLFSDNRREDQARKALENALGGKKNEFEKWDKEIKKREEIGGGGDSGGGGWSGWGRRFGWSNGDHFWSEAQQISLTLLGIIFLYLIIAKGDVMLALVFNPLLYTLRGTRDGFTSITAKLLGKKTQQNHDDKSTKETYALVSAKERVLRKWGSE